MPSPVFLAPAHCSVPKLCVEGKSFLYLPFLGARCPMSPPLMPLQDQGLHGWRNRETAGCHLSHLCLPELGLCQPPSPHVPSLEVLPRFSSFGNSLKGQIGLPDVLFQPAESARGCEVMAISGVSLGPVTPS